MSDAPERLCKKARNRIAHLPHDWHAGEYLPVGDLGYTAHCVGFVHDPPQLPWRQIAQALPEFVQWVVQRYGPVRDDELLTQDRYHELKAEYERERA